MILSEKNQTITQPGDVAKILQNILATEHEIDQKKEHAWVIGLNASNIIEYIELAFLGTLNFCSVHPREIFRLAIMKGVCSIIFIHNHPSGELTPSLSDKKTTERLLAGGELLGISVLDSIIVSSDSFFSFQDNGLIEVKK